MRRCSSILGTEMGMAEMLIDFIAPVATTEFPFAGSFH
jgi:hypothetical protein